MVGPRRAKSQTPDLFSAGFQREGRAEPGEAAPAQLLLPQDLQASLKHLSDADLLRLKSAAEDEAARRNLRVGLPARDNAAERFSAPRSAKPVPRPQKTSTLSPALAKVVRAAIKAGVKPNAVARQFGVSLAAIQKALSETET